VKDTYYPRIEVVVSTISYGGSLGQTLGLRIHGALADRVDVSPIVFALWVVKRVAIDF
jgi:hypothetical protein